MSRHTLFLHIGVQRTATASIRRFLALNRETLGARGFCAPDDGGDLLAGVFSGAVSAAELAERFRADCARASVLVVSDGNLAQRRDLSPLGRLAEQFTLRVIYTLRRQDLWLESWFRHNVIDQHDPTLAHLTFPEFLSRRDQFHWVDYDRTVRRIEALLGAEGVILSVFEPGQMPGGPLAAFVQALGAGPLEGFALPALATASLSPLMTEFLRNLPLDTLDPAGRARIRAACEKADAELSRAIPQSTLYMDSHTRRAVMADYRDGNRDLARRRFGREALFLDPLPEEGAPLAPQTLPAGSYDAMRLIVAPVLAEMARAADGPPGG